VDFTLTDDQELIRDTATRLVASECPPSVLREHMDDRAVAVRMWERLRDFAPLATSGCVERVLFLEPLGYAAVPGPFFATVALFGPLLAAAGDERADAVAAGELTGTVALAGANGIWSPAADESKYFVPDADVVQSIAVVDGDWRVRLLDAATCERTPIETVDSTRRWFVVRGASSAAPTMTVPPDTAERWIDSVHTAAAADLVGTARRLFDMALGYAKERVQFDRPIGSFQAIQHKLADMSLALERATAAVHYAAMAIDAEAAERARVAHTAKAAASAAAKRILKDAIQIHGGIGYTWEHDLHIYLRRATVGATQFGTVEWHHDRIAALLFAR
jgi:alkylation response protein AidB-like acyl-CoA dehydrogenase